MAFESRNPATGELIEIYPEHDKAETEVHCENGCSSWRLRELHRLPAGSLRRLPVALSTLG